MSIIKYLKLMVKENASDLFYHQAKDIRFRIDGEIKIIDRLDLSKDDVFKAIEEITNEAQREKLKINKDLDFTFYLKDIDAHFRVSIFLQRNTPSIVVRNLSQPIRSFEELNLPAEVLKKLCGERRGLVLLVGSAGSGKSTTIASMIEYINNNFCKHILTIEEPIEFYFEDKKSVINQRELGVDVPSYSAALRAFTLQSPDVIYIGNIRDYETMSASITAAETGVLVLSTLHTVNASQTIERIVNFFPPYQHNEVRHQISYLLKGIISLRLVPLKDRAGRIPACEIMLFTPTIARLIREGRIEEINRFIEEGGIFGMQSFTQALVKLVKDGLVSEKVAEDFSDNRDEFILALKGIKKI
ncbi:MAG: PilT/PilU family type 4a pilus ATPase [Candidatus Omnitrophica bacterium]|nr:PilT/PilU family type 4a pilus ATPase [Candidatus Omnitrophota bacterium]MCM8800035.1 PilT/PilU family type 4a pilus ATPase [Candidatus Omnitrophota bacterium]